MDLSRYRNISALMNCITVYFYIHVVSVRSTSRNYKYISLRILLAFFLLFKAKLSTCRHHHWRQISGWLEHLLCAHRFLFFYFTLIIMAHWHQLRSNFPFMQTLFFWWLNSYKLGQNVSLIGITCLCTLLWQVAFLFLRKQGTSEQHQV